MSVPSSTINPPHHTHKDNGHAHSSRPSLRLVQSEIVITVVLGGIFLSLVIVNIVFGTVLHAEEKKEKQRQRQRREGGGQRPHGRGIPHSPQKDLNTGPQTEGRRYRGHHNNTTDSIPQSHDMIDSHKQKDAYRFHTPIPRHRDEIEHRSNQSPINSEEDLSSHSIDHHHLTNIYTANLVGFEPQCPVRLVTFANISADATGTEPDGAMTSRATETAGQGLTQRHQQQHDSKKDVPSKNQSPKEGVKDISRIDTSDNSNLQSGGHVHVTSEGTKDVDKVGSNHSKSQIMMTSPGSIDSTTFDLDLTTGGVNTDNKHANESTKDDVELKVYVTKTDRVKSSEQETGVEGHIQNDKEVSELKPQQVVIPSQETANTHKNTGKETRVGREYNVMLEVEEPASCDAEADSSRVWIQNTQKVFADIHDQQEEVTTSDKPENDGTDSSSSSRSPVLDMCISDDAKRSYFTPRPQTRHSDQRETKEEHNTIVVTDASGIEPQPSTPLAGEPSIPTTPATTTYNHTHEPTITTESTERQTSNNNNNTATTQTKTIATKTYNKPTVKTHTTDNTPHRLFNRPDKNKDNEPIIKSSQSDNNIATHKNPKSLQDFLLFQENKPEKISKNYSDDKHRYFTAYENEATTTGQHFVKKSQTSTRFNLHFNPSYYTVQSRLLSTQGKTRVQHNTTDPVSPITTTIIHTSGPVTPYPRPFALTPMKSLYTLSEEDLKTYPDTSIPTIDELVRNDAAKKRYLDNTSHGVLGAHRIEPSIKTESDEAGLKIKRTNLRKKTKGDVSKLHKGSKEGNDDNMIGFHTGVSDQFHSVSLQRDSSLHRQLKSQIIPKPDESPFCHDVETMGDQNELFEQNYASYSMLKKDSFPVTPAEQHQGNWSLSILTPQSTESKDEESVSSFALSDFDFGESDVDEMKADNDIDNDDNVGEGMKHADNAIQDVLL